MRRTLAKDIVGFLSFPADSRSCADQVCSYSRRQWQPVIEWLDDAGLAFYFLQKLKKTNAVDAVPLWVISRLEASFVANQERVADMTRRFDVLNGAFHSAGVRYVVLKGLSLVPEFCPDAGLRYQGDFDYLVDEQSFSLAEKILLDVGYRALPSPSTQESIFVMPGTKERSRGAAQYSAQSPHAVELHLDIWDNEYDRVRMNAKLFFVDRARVQRSNGLEFPALSDEDAFLLQVLHACHHLFCEWIRMSCFYEIAYFLNGRASDAALWNRVEQRVGNDSRLREFVVVICETVAGLFAPSLPALVHDWGSKIRPGVRVWIDNYSRQWALCKLPVYQLNLFPSAKLVHFLHQQYRDDGPVVSDRPRPASRLSRIARGIRSDPSLVLNGGWWKHQLLLRRSIYHALAGLRYAAEYPRWRWLNRASTRSDSLNFQPAVDHGLASGIGAKREPEAAENRPANFAEL